MSWFFLRIGLSIAQQLGRDGAKVVVSSRKQDNVIKATATLENEGIDVLGIMCHVGKSEHRKNLVKRVMIKLYYCLPLGRTLQYVHTVL